MLGVKTLDTSKSSSSVLKSIESTVQKDVNKVISDVAKILNIHDFYSAHILDYCEVCTLALYLARDSRPHTNSTMTTGVL